MSQGVKPIKHSNCTGVSPAQRIHLLRLADSKQATDWSLPRQSDACDALKQPRQCNPICPPKSGVVPPWAPFFLFCSEPKSDRLFSYLTCCCRLVETRTVVQSWLKSVPLQGHLSALFFPPNDFNMDFVGKHFSLFLFCLHISRLALLHSFLWTLAQNPQSYMSWTVPSTPKNMYI